MKQTMILVIGIFMLYACSNNANEINNAEQNSSQESIFEEGNDLIVHVINDKLCFPCTPAFRQAVGIIDKCGVEHKNLVYLFPNMREVKRKAFFKKNFGLDIEDYRVIFDTEYYEEIKRKHKLTKQAYLLIYKKGELKTYQYIQHESIPTEMKKAIEAF